MCQSVLARCTDAFQGQPTHSDEASFGASRLDRAYVGGPAWLRARVVGRSPVVGGQRGWQAASGVNLTATAASCRIRSDPSARGALAALRPAVGVARGGDVGVAQGASPGGEPRSMQGLAGLSAQECGSLRLLRGASPDGRGRWRALSASTRLVAPRAHLEPRLLRGYHGPFAWVESSGGGCVGGRVVLGSGARRSPDV